MRIWFLAAIYCVSSVFGGQSPDERWGPKDLPFSEDARLKLAVTKKEYFLGENILVHYCLENAGNKPFRIDVGGDYRGGSRSLRFTVSATDAQGKKVADPDTSGYFLGGESLQPEIQPGNTFFESLPLLRYCRFDAPGVYTIRVTHDLGWRLPTGKSAPSAEIQITLLAPTERQARDIIDTISHLPDAPKNELGRMSEPFADFSVLRLPIYLPVLIELAEKGSDNAITGIGSIAAPEATQALLKFMESANPKIALAAIETLNSRLPDPEFDGATKLSRPFVDPWLTQRRELEKASWKPEFAIKLRELAKPLLNSDERRQIDAAFVFQCIGTKDDLSTILLALDAVLEKSKAEPRPKNQKPEPPGASDELLRAAEILIARGATIAVDPKTPGEIALFLNQLKVRKEFRPAAWEARCAAWLSSDIPFLRELCLSSMPALPAHCVGRVVELLNDSDTGVRIAACQLAGASNRNEFREPILKLASSAKESWLINAANNACYQLGALSECVDIWVNRLDEPGMEMISLTTLIRLIGIQNGFVAGGEISNEMAKTLKTAWQDFVKKYRQKILSETERFEVGGNELRAELFPPGFKLYKRDNKPWP